MPGGGLGGQWLVYQRIEVISHQGPIVIDLSLQNDEQEEQSQQDVPQVAEDVVKGARRNKIGTKLTFRPSGPSLSSAQQAVQSPTLPCSLLPTLPTPGPA